MNAKEATRILNDLPIERVGEFLGLRLPKNGMARCPLPNHDDKTPSFEVRHRGRRWVCYSCNLSGGPIDLVMACLGLKFMDARNWLRDKSGVFTPHRYEAYSLARSEPLERPPNAIEAASESDPDFEIYNALVERAPIQKSGKDYLRSRGISDLMIDKFSLAQMPNFDLALDLVDRYGFDRIQRSGLLTKGSTAAQIRGILPRNSLVFPFIEAGNVAYLQARNIFGSEKSNRWRNLNYRRRRIYNIDVVKAKKISRIAICEGVIDAISTVQMGCEAIGLIGVSASLSRDQMISLRGKQVDLLLDWDDAGDVRAALLRRELAKFGVAATRRTAPNGGAKDVNEMLLEGRRRI